MRIRGLKERITHLRGKKKLKKAKAKAIGQKEKSKSDELGSSRLSYVIPSLLKFITVARAPRHVAARDWLIFFNKKKSKKGKNLIKINKMNPKEGFTDALALN